MNKRLNIGDVVVLEENVENVVLDKIDYNNNTYILFSDTNDNTNISIRKEILTDDGLEIGGLDSEEELQNVVELFIKNNSEIL